MSTHQDDNLLHEIAKQRVGFKLHIVIALGVNILMWAIYHLTWTGYPWPLWTLAASLISLGIHWLVVFSSFLSVDKEYKKLKSNL